MADTPIPGRPPEITTGNAVSDGKFFNQWFVGDLGTWSVGREELPRLSNFGLRDNKSVEIKWGVHPKGEKRPDGWSPCAEIITLSILIRGKFLLRFRTPVDRDQEWEHTLTAEGDYAIWDEKVEHTWKAEDDSVILTIRWKENH